MAEYRFLGAKPGGDTNFRFLWQEPYHTAQLSRRTWEMWSTWPGIKGECRAILRINLYAGASCAPLEYFFYAVSPYSKCLWSKTTMSIAEKESDRLNFIYFIKINSEWKKRS